MKAKLLTLIGIAYVVLLSGCSTAQCGWQTDCWKKYFVETPCGTYVGSRCEKLCNKCTFNEPVCKACWKCMKHDGCMCGPADNLPCVSCAHARYFSFISRY